MEDEYMICEDPECYDFWAEEETQAEELSIQRYERESEELAVGHQNIEYDYYNRQ